jgi:hypothetical protein
MLINDFYFDINNEHFFTITYNSINYKNLYTLYMLTSYLTLFYISFFLNFLLFFYFILTITKKTIFKHKYSVYINIYS